MKDAALIVQTWIAHPSVSIAVSRKEHWGIVKPFLCDISTDPSTTKASKLVNDAHLAALAIEYNSTLYTADDDFKRFRGLKWVKLV